MAVGSLAILSVLASPLARGTIPVEGDFGGFFVSLKAFYAECLARGEAFDWMPHLKGGFFLTGEGEIGAYHPVHFLIYRWLPFQVAFHLDVFAPSPVMLAGMTLFLRRFVDGAGALMGAMLFTFSTTYMGVLGYPQMALALAHAPWLLWAMSALAGATTGSSRALFCAVIAFLTGSQVLSGHPPGLFYSVVIEAAFLLFLLVNRRASPASFALVLAGKTLGFVMGAVQIWATYSAFQISARAEFDARDIVLFSISPSMLKGTVAPYLFWSRVHNTGGIYFNAIPLVLVLFWLTILYGNKRRTHSTTGRRTRLAAPDRLAVWALLLTLYAFWMSTGFLGGLYYLQMALPVVGKIRAPARYLNLVQFGLCVISAVAFSRLVAFVKQGRKHDWFHLVLPWSLAAVSLVLAVSYIDARPHSKYLLPQASLYAAPLVFIATAVAATLACRGRRIGLVLLVSVAAVDLGFYGLGHPGSMGCWYGTQKYDNWKRRMIGPRKSKKGRLYYLDYRVNQLTLQGYRIINGYVGGLYPTRRLDYTELPALRVAGVVWLRPASRAEAEAVLGPNRPVERGWYRVPDPLPRARLVGKAIVSQKPARDLGRIDIQNEALVTRELGLGKNGEGEPGKTLILQDRPGSIRVMVNANQRALLVVSESHDPGWRALVDGKEVDLLRVNGDFMGCVVERGQHNVLLRFAPAAVRHGLPLSLAGLLAGLLLCLPSLVALVRRARRERSR
jgi:hypothetical protein